MKPTNKQHKQIEQLNTIADRLKVMQLQGDARFALRMRLTAMRVNIIHELDDEGVDIVITADGETILK